ncbi:MAG: hypothetical protein AAGD06_02945 [Acidobacteriota bacterium]
MPDSRSRRALLSLSAALLLLAVPAAAEQWTVSEVKTSIDFNEPLLDNLGLEVTDVTSPIVGFRHHDLSVARGSGMTFGTVAPLSLALEVDGSVLQDFVAGGLQHQGGFTLDWHGGSASLHAFVMRPTGVERTFEILDRQGRVLLIADNMHFEAHRDLGRLDVFNMDVRLTETLAKEMGEPGLAGTAIGTLALDASVVIPEGSAGPRGCPSNWGPNDVALIDIGSVTQDTRSGGLVAITPSARLKNVGTTDVAWYSKFSGSNPPYNNDQHPYLVWAMYRLMDGKIEQLAVSDIKHAFLTINVNCDPGACTDSHILGLGCEDVYSQGTNNSNNNLSHRFEVEAGPGLWDSTGSHFDQNGNGSQDHPPQNPDSGFDHRMTVFESDLDQSGATYLFEAWYLVRDDINIFNTMGYREVETNQSGSGNWSFPTQTPLIEGPALDAWVDPDSPPAGTSNVKLVVPSEGHVQLAMRTTDLGNGQVRYEYALMNHDLDRQIDSFSIPLAGTVPTDITFRDIDDVAGNDWQATVTAGSITWEIPGGALPTHDRHTGGPNLDWGMLYNFGFTAEAPAVNGAGTLGVAEAGTPSDLTIQTLVPDGASIIFRDGFESGTLNAWTP